MKRPTETDEMHKSILLCISSVFIIFIRGDPPSIFQSQREWKFHGIESSRRGIGVAPM
jgi:hypothetical protein